MKFTIAVVLIAFLSPLAEFFLPWWTIAVAAFLVALVIEQRPGKAFLSGFLGVTLFWCSDILFKDFSNAHLLSAKLAKLFHLPGYPIFIAVCVLLGALPAGLASLSGALLRAKPPRRKY